MKLIEIKVSELADFLSSPLFKHSKILPISSLRAFSQIENPHANAEDTALVIALNNAEEIVAYAGALPEKNPYQSEIRAAWSSCWYASEGYGKYAVPVLYKLAAAYKGFLMMRDLSKTSREPVLQSGKFVRAKELHAAKYWFRFSASESLISRRPELKKIAFLLKFFDGIADGLFSIFKKRYKKLPPEISYSLHEKAEGETAEMIDFFCRSDIFARDANFLNQVVQYPWVTHKPSARDISEQGRYYFSIVKKQVFTRFVKLKENGRAFAVLFLRITDGELRIPYLFAEKKHYPLIADFIVFFIRKKKCSRFLTFNPGIVREISGRYKNAFVYSKEFKTEFVVHKNMLSRLPENYNFQDGEGDMVYV